MQKQVLSSEEWVKCSAVLTAATGKKFTDEQMDVWYDCLSDIPYSRLKKACLRALQESESGFLPAIGLIRRFASECDLGSLPAAAQEWEAVLKAIRTLGWYRKAEMSASLSPLAREVVRSIGWDVLCSSENISIEAAQFRMAYEKLAAQEVSQRRLSEDVRPRIEATPRIENSRQRTADVVAKLADRFSVPEGKNLPRTPK